MAAPNRLQRTLGKLSFLPGPLRKAARNMALRNAVPLTGTAGLDFVEITPERLSGRGFTFAEEPERYNG